MNIQKNRQKVFDKALAHLRKQGEISYGPGGCAYRGDAGLMCAIGIFIHDKEYTPELEGKRANHILSHLPQSVSMTGADFLGDLQSRLHDDLSERAFRDELEIAAARVAEIYHLQYSAPVVTP